MLRELIFAVIVEKSCNTRRYFYKVGLDAEQSNFILSHFALMVIS